MSQWEGDKEVGLSIGQTEGEVGGVTVVRPPGSDISTTYIPGVGSVSIKIEGGASGNIGDITTVRRDQYGNVIGVKRTSPEGGVIFERKLTPGGGYVESGLPENVQKQFYDIEKTRAEMPLYRRAAAYRRKKEQEQQDRIPEGYEHYVTIEGTSLYIKKSRPNEVYVPRFGKMIPAEEYWAKHPTPFMKAEKAFTKAEKEFSDKYKLKETVADAVKAFRHAQFLAEYDPKYKKYGGGQSKLGKAASEYAIGFTEELAEKPLTAAGNMAFALLVTKGAGGLLSKVPALGTGLGAGKVASKINAVNILGVGLAGMYGISVAERYIKAPNKAKFLGGLTSTELLPIAAGGYLGTRKFPSIPTKEITRRAEITYLNSVQKGRILQAKTGREFERFLLDESAELLKRKKAYQKLIQVHKPEVAKKAEAIEVIRADIALEKQLKVEAKVKQMSITSPKYNIKYRKALKILQHPETLQMPMIIALNIQKAEAILKPEAITIQKSVAGQRLQPIQIPEAIAKAIPVQEAKAIVEAKAILKAEQKASQIEKAKEILRPKQKPKIEGFKKILPPLLPKRFAEEIEERAGRKRRAKWVWDVRNPVPTLEDIL